LTLTKKPMKLRSSTVRARTRKLRKKNSSKLLPGLKISKPPDTGRLFL
jgi:hypothetical protein